MYELTKKKVPLWAKVIGFLFLCGIVSEILTIMRTPPGVEESLVQTSQQINRQCPMMIDSTTRLDNTAVLAGNYLSYHYTIIQLADLIRMDTAYYKAAMKQDIINRMKTNPKFASEKDLGVGFAATWYDDSGVYVCSMIVHPEDYQ